MTILEKSTPRRAATWAGALLVVLGACGVADHPHDLPALDPSNDFGSGGGSDFTGSGGSGGTSGPTGSSGSGTGAGATGGMGTSGSGGSGTPGSGGIGAGTGGSGGSVTGGSGGGNSGAGGTGGQPPKSDGGVAGSGGSAGSVNQPDAAAPDTGAPSGAFLPLGGVNVPKEKVIAFIHLGHSNMAGRASSPTASRPYHLTTTDPHAWMYHVGSTPALAIEPNTAGDAQPGINAGPGTSLVKQAAAMGTDLYALSLGFGKGSAYCSQFLPGALYYHSLIAAPKAVKGRVTFAAIVIMLGTTERHGTASDVAGYPDCINQLVTAIRNDVGEPNLPLLLTDYEQNATGEFALNGAVATAIIPQIRKVPALVKNSALVNTDGITMEDDHHFNLDGQKEWTRRALQILKTKGWAPWAP